MKEDTWSSCTTLKDVFEEAKTTQGVNTSGKELFDALANLGVSTASLRVRVEGEVSVQPGKMPKSEDVVMRVTGCPKNREDRCGECIMNVVAGEAAGLRVIEAMRTVL